jgi:hypothetical protein
MIVWRMGLTQALDHVVKEFGPDTTYPNELKDKGTCRYVHPDGMSALCLWGQVLKHMGVPLAWLQAHERKGVDSLLGKLARDKGLQVTQEEMNAAFVSQNAQDDGKTWGEAAVEYHQFLKRRRKWVSG